MSRNEKQTRIQLINPALRLAGWNVLNELHIIEPGVACIETPVSGMPKTMENTTGNGFIDYVLFGDDGKPLAVVEAKKSVINAEQGRVQACLYADALEKRYGVRPIIYYTNGYTFTIIDGIYPARQVFGFHTKEELEYLIQKRSFQIVDTLVDKNICDRYYQKDAISEVLEHLKTKHSRSLIVLATGTGKTRVSCALSEIFIRNNFVKRILFLADRKNLVRQAKEDTFEKFMPTVPMTVIADGQKESDDSKARIVFSTYQSMISIIKDSKKCPYGIGHFDLIIVDEAHRSLFNKYGDIFDYFDALMIGLTATPRNDIHKSTYRIFNLDTDMPNYEYDVVKGVKDGYLTYYRALDRTPDILKNGVTYSELSPEEQEQYEDLFTEEDGNMPESVDGSQFYSVITNRDTIREVLKDLMEEGIKVNNGDVLGKTIIFARDHNHALMIQEEFRDMFKEYCLTDNRNGVDYCVVIDNQIKYNEVLQREFKNKQDIRIVVSVDMMDTGVDIPEVVNLVFFKKVMSKIKFWQMIGRGTRLCKGIKVVSPSKAYFERLTNDTSRELYEDKQGFLIFDICNVFPYFKLKPEGRIDKSDAVLSLYQKIFLQKVALYKTMQFHYSKLGIEDKKFYDSLRDELVQEVRDLNRNLIGVHKNLEYVERYSKVNNWLNFTQEHFVEVKKYIAPNVQGEIDLESARNFDYLCYKFATYKFTPNDDFKKVIKMIYTFVSYLINFKGHIEEVKNKMDILNFVVTDEFINGATVTKVDEVRKEIRNLIRYIEVEKMPPLVSDFDDRISEFNDAVEQDVDFRITIDDFKTLEEKTIFYIQSNPNDELVHQVHNLIKPTDYAIRKFEDEIVKVTKSHEEFISTFKDELEIVSFVRRNIELNPNAVNAFIDKQKSYGFNDIQIAYVKELLLFISQNGCFDRSDLLREELDFRGIFNSIEINQLINSIEEII